jgi:hypothetical protein
LEPDTVPNIARENALWPRLPPQRQIARSAPPRPVSSARTVSAGHRLVAEHQD